MLLAAKGSGRHPFQALAIMAGAVTDGPLTGMWRSSVHEYCKDNKNLNLDPSGYFRCSLCNKTYSTPFITSRFPLKAFQLKYWKNITNSNLFDLSNAHYRIKIWIKIANAKPDMNELVKYLKQLSEVNTYDDWKKIIRSPKSLFEFTEVEKIASNFIEQKNIRAKKKLEENRIKRMKLRSMMNSKKHL